MKIMGFFPSVKKNYVGIDIGSSAVKMVECASHGGRARLVTYGYAEADLNVMHASSPEDEKRAASVIKRVYEESHVSTKRTIAALPNFSVFSSIISLPYMSKKELAQAVTWEAKKFVPLPIEDMVLDWRPLDQRKSEDKKKKKNGDTEQQEYQRILITAAPKDLVERYVRIFKMAELELVAMETESFALERSLVGRDPSVIMLVDLGAFSTDISIVESGIPVLSRSIDVGGSTITKAIAQSLNIADKRADQFKQDIGFSTQATNNIPKIIESTISPIINEIKYSFDLFQGRNKSDVVEKIVLTGGSSVVPGLTNYLKDILNINVYIGDPWARVIYPVELKSILQELGPRFSISIGLAMREIV